MAESAFGQGPGVTLTISTGTPSVDALKALVKIIEKIQKEVANGLTTTAIIGGGEIMAYESGNNPHELHSFEFQATTDFDANVFVVTYEGLASL